MAIRERARVQKTRTFVVPETTIGEMAFPTASNGLLTVGRPTFTAQVGEQEESGWLFDTRTSQPGCTKNFAPQAFNLSIYITKPGTPGTTTNEHNVLEAALGVATINTGTSIDYEPAFDRLTQTIYIMHEHTMYILTGSVYTSWNMKMAPSDTCRFQVDCGGMYMRMHVVGSAPLTAAASTGATTLTVGTTNINRYLGYGLVSLESADGLTTDDNGGAGYKIIDVDYAAGTITLDASAPIVSNFAIGDYVLPFLPDFTPNSSPIDGKSIEAIADGVAFDVYSMELKGTENVTFTKQLSLYPEGFDEQDKRQIELTCMGFMKPETAAYFNKINQQQVMTIQSKSTVPSGEKIEIDLYDVRFTSVQPGEEGPAMNVTFTGLVKGTKEDEFKVTLK